ncbi:acetolactate synthase I/II/III large subunit [Virgisporangium aliadipatigenens]|uniref:Acetolactate synthase I/II/III large subunit n=1 Tax=Virgisporangium aliadipatigenens TaxID=741659 RepID=A0A8J4DQ69_9ACTN|nr:thiamine pyrophosphate-binding protein [Virgisporangium aliadipatigenens]GIJ46284.1 acetolactate synthase I/II/III large subunit [Virgisporangium aliadipatigenens]
MRVSEAVARTLVDCGADHVFGLVGSGNFHVTNALVAAGARFVPAVHEGGAAVMADAFARVSGRPAVLSLHQGPGVTNALTGIAEAAKSRSPLVVLAAEAPNPRSNFHIDLPALAAAVGAVFHRIHPENVAECVAGVWDTATRGAGRTVVLGLPLDVQAREVAFSPVAPVPADPEPAPDVAALVAALRAARRPVFIAGRGAARRPIEAREALTRLASRTGALLAVSAAAKGLFAGDPWYLDVSGGFATPLAAELIAGSDLVVAWGSTLNMWTTRHGALIGPAAIVAQVDLEPGALVVNRPVDVPVTGDVVAVADACAVGLGPDVRPGWRTGALRERIAAGGRWRTVSYVDDPPPGRIDPRTLSVLLDDLLPAERTVVVDSGNFMGYPAMFLDVPDAAGFCFTQAFQSIGLGLSSALGAALARPDRLTVAALGDGGFLMSSAELATAARLGGPLLVVVYDDAAYGAEVHHFGPGGHPLDTVTLPDADLAEIARGHGCRGATVRSAGDLDAVREWLAAPRGVFVVDAKVDARRGSWWLEEAFRGH